MGVLERVDVVICRNFINLLTVKGSDRLLALIHRMLRPGGVVFLEGQKEIFVQNGEELAKHCQEKSVVWLKTLYFTPKGQKQKETLLQSVYIEEDQKSTGNFLPIHSIESVGEIAETKVRFSKQKIALTQKDLQEIKGICRRKSEGSLEQSLKVKRVFTPNYMKRYLQRGGFRVLEMYEEQAKRSFGSWALEKKSICAFSQKPFISETKSNQS